MWTSGVKRCSTQDTAQYDGSFSSPGQVYSQAALLHAALHHLNAGLLLFLLLQLEARTGSRAATGRRRAVKQAAMLSKKERELIAEIWEKLTPVAEDIGSDALLRMFASYPGTKTYFSHLDISARSAHLLSHGKKIVLAIAEGAKDISQLTVTLAPLQTLHAYQLRIDPTNFKLFSHCMLVTLACHMGDDFTAVAHAAMDKYLSAFAAVLAEKYR